MTEFNSPLDRVEASNWFSATDALAELDNLKLAFSALVETLTDPGSNERETARNACCGVRYRINYLHDSLRRLLASQAKGQP